MRVYFEYRWGVNKKDAHDFTERPPVKFSKLLSASQIFKDSNWDYKAVFMVTRLEEQIL